MPITRFDFAQRATIRLRLGRWLSGAEASNTQILIFNVLHYETFEVYFSLNTTLLTNAIYRMYLGKGYAFP